MVACGGGGDGSEDWEWKKSVMGSLESGDEISRARVEAESGEVTAEDMESIAWVSVGDMVFGVRWEEEDEEEEEEEAAEGGAREAEFKGKYFPVVASSSVPRRKERRREAAGV